MDLYQRLTAQKDITGSHQRIDFAGNASLKSHHQEKGDIIPRIHTSDLFNTSITYNGSFYLKMYRKVDTMINPDLEITRFLTKETKFEHIPAFIGSIEWRQKKGCIVLGLMQEMIENHGDGQSYFQERIHNFIERLLADGRDTRLWKERAGTLMDPVSFDSLPAELQTLLGSHASEQARLMGIRTGELHLALAAGSESKDFRPEAFSLHYQRSLFSTLQ